MLLIEKLQNKLSNFTIIFIISIIPFVLFSIDFFVGHSTGIYKAAYVAINYCLAAILIIHVCASDSIKKRKSHLKNCFTKNTHYEDLYNEYDNLSNLECKMHRHLKITFRLLWLFITLFYIGIAISYASACKSLSGCYAIVQFGITMYYNEKSYFNCIAYVHFLYKLSSNKNNSSLRKYQYNKYLPASSFGFKRLLSYVHINATCFLFVALLQTISFFLITAINPKIIDLSKYISILAIVFDISFGIGSCILIYLAPKFLLRRILNKWIEHSNRIFEEKIFNLKDADPNIPIVLDYIQRLKKERIFFDRDIIEIVIAVSAVIVSIATLGFGILYK